MESDKPVPKDTRTKEEKIGSINARKSLDVPMPVVSTTKPMSTISNKKRNSARALALDYAEPVILNLFDIAMNGKTESARVEACKQIIYLGVGRPATVHVDAGGTPLIPTFNLIFNGQTIVQAEQTIPVNYIEDEQDAEEED